MGQRQNFTAGVILQTAVIAYYVVPSAACLALALGASGFVWYTLLAGAVAWPVGNVVAAAMLGCD